ncbi:MAG: YdcF family protein [bacterium]
MKIRFKKILFGLIIVVLCFFFIFIHKIYKQSVIDEAQKADVIVVLGASQWNGQPSPVLRNRLDHAYSLYRLKFSNKFILTGGVGEGENVSESQAGKNYLMQKGVEEENIFIEEKSKTTWQNLNEAKNILEQKKFNSIILVSDGFHMFRLKQMANDLEIENYISPVEAGKNKLTNFKYVLRESVVYILYKLFKI